MEVYHSATYKPHFGPSVRPSLHMSVRHKVLCWGSPPLPTSPRLMLPYIRPCWHVNVCDLSGKMRQYHHLNNQYFHYHHFYYYSHHYYKNWRRWRQWGKNWSRWLDLLWSANRYLKADFVILILINLMRHSVIENCILLRTSYCYIFLCSVISKCLLW